MFQCIYNLSLEDQDGFYDNFEDEEGKEMQEESTEANDERPAVPASSLCFRTTSIKYVSTSFTSIRVIFCVDWMADLSYFEGKFHVYYAICVR